jgi:PAS domain S-box-containing protein
VPDSLIDLAGLQVGAEDFLGTVLETIAQPIWVVDPDGVIRFANPAAIAALGYDSADELFGRRSHETIHHSHPDGTPYPAADCPMLLPRATGETVTSDLDWFFRRDGSMFPVSYISVPLDMRDGRGAVVAFTDIEDRLRAERDLRERDERLAAQQASLRRVATLVAGGAASAEVVAAVAREVASLLELQVVWIARYEPDGTVTVIGAWSDRRQPFEAGARWPLDGPTILTQVKQTGRPVRRDDYGDLPGAIADAARANGIRSGAGAPIIVDGQVWGVMATWGWDGEPLPDHIEARLAEFTALIAAAFSNTASRDDVARLADEQAALRRVATLVARQSSPTEVFRAVAEEVAQLLGTGAVGMLRFEPDGTATLVAQSATPWDPPPLGTRFTLDGENVVASVLRTGRANRLDDWANASGAVAAMARSLGIRSSVASPIVVEGRLWGTMVAVTAQVEPLPADTESRIGEFTELVATAISNAEAWGQVSQLAEEQAALRRVATRVAEGVPSGETFEAVITEIGRQLPVDAATLGRYENDGALVTPIGFWNRSGEDLVPIGARYPVERGSLSQLVLESGGPARVDDFADAPGSLAELARRVGWRSTVGAPVIVEGRVWGLVGVASTTDRALPADTEERLAAFAELLGTAIANAQSREDLTRLAEEQAALRRVATLVARGVPPADVFEAIARGAGRLLGVDAMHMGRYDTGGAISVAGWSRAGDHLPVGTRVKLDGTNVASLVLQSGRPERIDGYSAATGTTTERLRHGMRVYSSVAVPLVVDGRLWGLMIASSKRSEPLPAHTESRLLGFTELAEMAISKTEARTELAASRARLVAAADEERRRVVRDLHDGAQQRLVHTVITMKLARRALDGGDDVGPFLVEALDQAERANVELRELAHGILPAVLARGGLRAGVTRTRARAPERGRPATADASRPAGRRWPRARRCRSTSASPSAAFPPLSKPPPTSSSPRRSPTSRNTPAPSAPR